MQLTATVRLEEIQAQDKRTIAIVVPIGLKTPITTYLYGKMRDDLVVNKPYILSGKYNKDRATGQLIFYTNYFTRIGFLDDAPPLRQVNCWGYVYGGVKTGKSQKGSTWGKFRLGAKAGKEVIWTDCVSYKEGLVNGVFPYIKDKTALIVSGRLEENEYKGKRYDSITVDNLEFLPQKSSGGLSPSAQEAQDNLDAVPF